MANLGMMGTGDWATDERPKSWREKILHLYPNGDAPLTAILSKMKSESVDDYEFNWWTKGLATQAATVTSVYTNATFVTEYTTGGAAGDTLYAKVTTTADAKQFRPGHIVKLVNTDNYADDCVARVVSVTPNGASSQIAVTLLEADPTTTGIADCNRILIIGNSNPQGGVMPQAVSYNPTKYYNKTQIFRTPLSIDRTTRQTRSRTGDKYKELKREALELHSLEMEKAFIWGIMTENTGDNGKPETTTAGLVRTIIDNSGNVSNFVTETDAAYAGKTWLEAGEEWLDNQLTEIFRYGGREKLAFCGTTTINAINKLVKEYGNYSISSDTAEYGLAVSAWKTPFGVINLMTHPLFSWEASERNNMVIFEPKDLVFRYIQDTKFYKEGETQNTGRGRIDGTEEEFLTEAGLEFHHYEKTGFLTGFGSDNTQ